MWWSAEFQNPEWIWQVRIMNRRDCCGDRLGGVSVMIDNDECGRVPMGTKNGKWYTVKCSRPLQGKNLRLITTRNEYLSISGIQAYSARVMFMSRTVTSTSRTRQGPP
jgi:hypothetical protein